VIDLHSHTNESDGTTTPGELVALAAATGLSTVAITDHDTFAGYEKAAAHAAGAGIDLVRGIELNSKHEGRAVHVLGYFLDGNPAPELQRWLDSVLESRRDRNRRLVERLRGLGLDITLDEVEGRGRTLAGRPHFARILVDKGYAANREEAFRKYIGENARGYVERETSSTAEAIERLQRAGGIASLAHPVRLGIRDAAAEERFIAGLRDAGLRAIEVWHSDHRPSDVARYLAIAEKHELAMTGGSDFHGENKPGVQLGTGISGNLRIPESVLERLRARSR
jgi:3',5'-nucleoside bisphosphate phosphatase